MKSINKSMSYVSLSIVLLYCFFLEAESSFDKVLSCYETLEQLIIQQSQFLEKHDQLISEECKMVEKNISICRKALRSLVRVLPGASEKLSKSLDKMIIIFLTKVPADYSVKITESS